MKISKFMSGERKRLPPIWIHIICIVIGISMLVVNYFLSSDKSTLSSGSLFALGVSIIAGAFINAILTIRNDRDRNWRAFEQAYYESITIKDRIRYSQRVELIFEVVECDNKKCMKLTTHHSFNFYNKTNTTQNYRLMKLFNDYHPPKNSECHECSKFNCELYCDKDAIELSHKQRGGKMEITIIDIKQSIIRLHPKECVHIRYEIENFYSLHDRLIWSFQEISDGAMLAFRTEKVLPENEARSGIYSLTILHPEADEIKSKHRKKFINVESGQINLSNSKVLPIEIEICNIILPYQGFEIAWNIGIPSQNTE